MNKILKVHANGIAVQIFYEDESCVRAVFCHNKYRFFDLIDDEYVEVEIQQYGELMKIKHWEEFKIKVKNKFDLDIDNCHKPDYVK